MNDAAAAACPHDELVTEPELRLPQCRRCRRGVMECERCGAKAIGGQVKGWTKRGAKIGGSHTVWYRCDTCPSA